MRDFRMLFGIVRHMARIGEDERHKALRARNEARLAALKAANRLYEDKSATAANRQPNPASNTTWQQRAQFSTQFNEYDFRSQLAANGYEAGSALASILGISSGYFDPDKR